MKLRNKKTGEIKECIVIPIDNNGYPTEYEVFEKGKSLAELNEEWEDYEEPEEIWYLDWKGDIHLASIENDWKYEKQIGNYFETREEAEKAVEKLKAWKRLKDKGFRFDGYDEDFEGRWVIYPNDTEGTWCLAEDKADLDLLFGGEE